MPEVSCMELWKLIQVRGWHGSVTWNFVIHCTFQIRMVASCIAIRCIDIHFGRVEEISHETKSRWFHWTWNILLKNTGWDSGIPCLGIDSGNISFITVIIFAFTSLINPFTHWKTLCRQGHPKLTMNKNGIQNHWRMQKWRSIKDRV